MTANELDNFVISFLSACKGNTGNEGNRQEILTNNSGLNLSSSVPPIHIAPDRVERGNVNLFVDVPCVPSVPSRRMSDRDLFMQQMFDAAVKLIADGDEAWPPEVDDLTARCINRMGGWVTVMKQWRAMDTDAKHAAFDPLIREFISYKDSRFYMHDRMPVLDGAEGKTPAFRLSWPLHLSTGSVDLP